MSRWILNSLILTLTLTGSMASAEVGFLGFKWKADSRFLVGIQQGDQQLGIKGTVRDGDATQVKESGLTIDILTYIEGFLAVVVVEDGSEKGQVFILERQNGQYVNITASPIVGASSTLAADVATVLKALRQTNQWDASLSFRAMNGYFQVSPSKSMTDFLDAVEVGHIKSIPKPIAKPDRLPVQEEPSVAEGQAPGEGQTTGPQVDGELPVRKQAKRRPRPQYDQYGYPIQPRDQRRRYRQPPRGMDPDDYNFLQFGGQPRSGYRRNYDPYYSNPDGY